MTVHEDQITLRDEVAGALVACQFPRWARQPVRRVEQSGTVNTIFRIGEQHAARFPLLGTDPERARHLLEAEARASAELARHCPFPAPVPVGLGAPGHGYPLPRTGPDTMTHGDLIPGNVLVADGRLAGVLDTGGFAAADPALDVIAAWTLLDDGPRELFRAELGCDDLEWERSKAWAFEQAVGAVWYYAGTNPVMHRTGRRSLERIVAATPP